MNVAFSIIAIIILVVSILLFRRTRATTKKRPPSPDRLGKVQPDARFHSVSLENLSDACAAAYAIASLSITTIVAWLVIADIVGQLLLVTPAAQRRSNATGATGGTTTRIIISRSLPIAKWPTSKPQIYGSPYLPLCKSFSNSDTHVERWPA